MNTQDLLYDEYYDEEDYQEDDFNNESLDEELQPYVKDSIDVAEAQVDLLEIAEKQQLEKFAKQNAPKQPSLKQPEKQVVVEYTDDVLKYLPKKGPDDEYFEFYDSGSAQNARLDDIDYHINVVECLKMGMLVLYCYLTL